MYEEGDNIANEKPKRKTHTSSIVKDRYNAKVYDSIMLRVTKGKKTELQAHATTRGESLNGFVNRAIAETLERDKS